LAHTYRSQSTPDTGDLSLAGVLAWADMADTASSAATVHASVDLFKMIISVG